MKYFLMIASIVLGSTFLLLVVSDNSIYTGSLLNVVFRPDAKPIVPPCLSGDKIKKFEIRPQSLDALRSMCERILLSEKGKLAKKCVDTLNNSLDSKIDECRAIEFEINNPSSDNKDKQLEQCQEELNTLLQKINSSTCRGDYEKSFQICYKNPYFNYLRNAPDTSVK